MVSEPKMREILFRGKKIHGGDWIAGDLLHGYVDGGDAWIWIDRDARIPGYNKHPDLGGPDQVIPETVGQFTGKTHKSGAKIFEGDILEYWDTFAGAQRFVVAWDDSAAAWTMQYKEGKRARSIYLEPLLTDMEIIGNIHDNPELLEVPHA